jgi:RHS repeat-associated protein
MSEATPQGSVGYTYDAAGRRTSMTVAGQSSVTYAYDNANRLTQITQGSSTVTYAYDAAGRRTSGTLPNGVVGEYAYDGAYRLTSITYKQNGTTVLGDLTYEYDKNGRRTKVGGSYARSGIPQAISSTAYNAANHQTTFADKTLTYDNNGNLQTIVDPSGTTTYTWNARNQLVGIGGPGVNASFVYDAFGRREKKTINGSLIEFLYDGADPVQETSGATILANVLSGAGVDELITRTDAGTGATSTFLTDALGSSVALANASGVVQTEYTYEPFGKTSFAGSSNSSSYQYTGRENDSTGLYYYRARYYHPALQRFISEDPLGFAAGDPNLYAYTGNSPTNFTDPSGNFVPTPVVAATLCAVGAVAGVYGVHALTVGGRKGPSGGEIFAGAAGGCAAGVALGWGIGIGLESMFPYLMLAGGQAQLYTGIGASGAAIAAAQASASGGAVVQSTFFGSALALAERAGLSGQGVDALWRFLSANFASGAGSASVLFGPEANAAKTFATHELPALVENGASIVIRYVH